MGSSGLCGACPSRSSAHVHYVEQVTRGPRGLLRRRVRARAVPPARAAAANANGVELVRCSRGCIGRGGRDGGGRRRRGCNG